MTDFIVLNRSEKRIKNLKPIDGTAIMTSVLNGESVFEVSTYDIGDIQKNYRILFRDNELAWHEYIIKEIVEDRTVDGIVWSLFCENSFYETWGDYINDVRLKDSSASYALTKALEPTRWQIGHVDNLGTQTLNFYRCSSREAVHEILKVFGGEIQFRIIVLSNGTIIRYVDIYNKLGEITGKRFEFTRNLNSIKKTIIQDDVITALYGYGKGEEVGDGYSRRIDFASINNGKAYLENTAAKLIWGRLSGNGNVRHNVFGKIEFDDIEDKQELKKATQKALDEMSQPKITYESSINFMGDVSLGDEILIVDNEYSPKLNLQARVIEIKYNITDYHKSKIKLGNFVDDIARYNERLQRQLAELRSRAGVWDRANIIDSGGIISSDHVRDIMDAWNRELSSTSGYVYAVPGQGIMTYDKPIDQNPTSVIQLVGGAFRIANSKIGGEWDFKTIGTGDGFLAQQMFADQILANMIVMQTESTGSGGTTFTPINELILENLEKTSNIFQGEGVISSVERNVVNDTIAKVQSEIKIAIAQINYEGNIEDGYSDTLPDIPTEDNLKDPKILIGYLNKRGGKFVEVLDEKTKSGTTYEEFREGEEDIKARYNEYLEIIEAANEYISFQIRENHREITEKYEEISSEIGKYKEQLKLEANKISMVMTIDGSPVEAMTLTRDELAFLLNGSKEVWIGTNGLNADNGTFQNNLSIGNHTFEQNGTNYTVVTWAGAGG